MKSFVSATTTTFTIILLLVASANAQLATFQGVPFAQRNYDTYLSSNANFSCALNVYNRGITGCTTLVTQATTLYPSSGEDWKIACGRVANLFNRDPTNVSPINAFTRIFAAGEATFGCVFRHCVDDSAYTLLTGADDGQRSALLPPSFYCGREPVGQVRAYGGTTLANSVANNPSGSQALLERSIVSLHPTRFHSTITTYCALRFDRTVACWGKNLYDTTGLVGVQKIKATRDAHVFLLDDGTIQLRGTATLGGSFTNPASAGNINSAALAASGLASDIECSINGGCMLLLSDGRSAYWGEAQGTPSAQTATAIQQPGNEFVALYSTFQAFLLVRRNGTAVVTGFSTYGGGQGAAAPDVSLDAVNITKVVSNQNCFGVLTASGTSMSWGGPSNQCRSTSIAAALSVPGAVADIKAGNYIGVQFLMTNGDLYSLSPNILTPISGVASLFPDGFSLHQSNFAVKMQSGEVRAYAANGVVAGTINDGKNYITCEGSAAVIICLSDDGQIARLVGVAGTFPIPAGENLGITKLIAGGSGVAALNENTGRVYTIGTAVQPSAGQVANELTAGVTQVVGAQASFAVVRGIGQAETFFPTVSPTFSPTLSPSVSPSLSPTFSPTVSPSLSPSMYPTQSPSNVGDTSSPTMSPSQFPSTSPSKSPSNSPSFSPSHSPSISPSSSPTQFPTNFPTFSVTLPAVTDPDCTGLRDAAVADGESSVAYASALNALNIVKQRSCARELFEHQLQRTSPTQPVANWGLDARAVFSNGQVLSPTETPIALGSRARVLQYTIPDGATTFVAQCICDDSEAASCLTRMYFTDDDPFAAFSAWRPYNANGNQLVQCVENQVTLQVALLPTSTRRQLQGGGSTPSGSNGGDETLSPTQLPTTRSPTRLPTNNNGPTVPRQCGCPAPTPSI